MAWTRSVTRCFRGRIVQPTPCSPLSCTRQRQWGRGTHWAGTVPPGWADWEYNFSFLSFKPYTSSLDVMVVGNIQWGTRYFWLRCFLLFWRTENSSSVVHGKCQDFKEGVVSCQDAWLSFIISVVFPYCQPSAHSHKKTCQEKRFLSHRLYNDSEFEVKSELLSYL